MEELILRVFREEATEEERARLEAWKRESETNRTEFQEVWRALELARTALEETEKPSPPGTRSIIRKAEDRARDRFRHPERDLPGPSAGDHPLNSGADNVHEDQLGAGPRKFFDAHLWKAAAVAALLVPAGIGLGALLGDRETSTPERVSTQVSTGAQERTTLSLGEMSVRLGPMSRLTVQESGEGTEVYLDGRAFFAVESHPTRTFTVRTRQGEAHVLGTRFEVRSEEEEFRVLVVDGRVRVAAAQASALLSPGDLSRSRAGQGLSTSRVADVYGELDWMGNALVFQGTPLETVLDEIERRYGVPVILQDPELARVPLTVTFTDQDVEQVILVVCETLRVRCSVENDRVRIGMGPTSGSAKADDPIEMI